MRRLSLLVLAALMSLSAISPVSAARPSDGATPPVEPTVEPAATEEATEPTPEAAEPTADPSDEPTADPTPEATPTDMTPDPSPSEPAESTGPDEPDPSSDPVDATEPSETIEPAGEPAPDAIDAADASEPTEAGEYIVLLRPGTDAQAEAERHRKKDGVKADRTFERAIKGYAARLDEDQLEALDEDPDVLAIVPDETFEVQAQTVPTGVSRVGTKSSAIAKINGVDERVDADVAIVDTGIQPNHPDLNVVGGYNCSTTNRSLWRDLQGHGTHVAGTVGALDNTYGAVGVAPGARLWAVKILDDSGSGKLSWYVCGLDWILSQRDPNDSSRPLFESVNMSVGKPRTVADDGNCGKTTIDALHQAICRVVKAGIPVAVAAGNYSSNAKNYIPAMYSEVITVSALADTDGKSGALGGNRCYSWGGYDRDDTFADFSNYGAGVDIMAPGKCIWSTKRGSTYGYSSGTSMATPAVAGAIALYKASRPNATPADVKEGLQYLGNLGWKTGSDPDVYHEKLLDVSRIGALGTFSLGVPTPGYIGEKGGLSQVTVSIGRSTTFFERVRLSVADLPSGWSATLNPSSVLGWSAKSAVVNVTVPAGERSGTYELRVTGTNQGRTKTTVVPVVVGADRPTIAPPTLRLSSGSRLDSTVSGVVSWSAATDASSAITGYQWEYRRNAGSWSSTYSTSASVRSVSKPLAPGVSYDFRVRAKDAAGNWSAWAVTTKAFVASVKNDRSSSLSYRGSWYNRTNSSATSGTLKHSRSTGATMRYTSTVRGFAVVAPTSRSRGWLEIRVNGTLVKTVSLKSSSLRHRRVVWAASYPTSASRTIELRVVRSSAQPLVSLDALIVLR